MMRLAVCWLAALLCFVSPAAAADLTGAWTTDAAYCGKVYVKNGSNISFAKDALLEGGGFIIEGKEIRAPSGSCRIKAIKDDGAVTHILASCASEIMLSDNHFSLKTIDANTILRLFPGMPDLETRYYRCPM
jgi:hypothetical protein